MINMQPEADTWQEQVTSLLPEYPIKVIKTSNASPAVANKITKVLVLMMIPRNHRIYITLAFLSYRETSYLTEISNDTTKYFYEINGKFLSKEGNGMTSEENKTQK